MQQHRFEFADESLDRIGRVRRAKACRSQLISLFEEANEVYSVIHMLKKELAELRQLHEKEGYDSSEI